jgi:hypothetical protein
MQTKPFPEETNYAVAILVPIYRNIISPEEKVSLRHLIKYLCHYDKYMIVPADLNITYSGFKIKHFPKEYFKNRNTYSKLMLSKSFYEVFLNYRYILIYQLDCLAFSEDLISWCEKDFDYIGAPWFRSKHDPYDGFSRVGNGGLSLRKVASFLKVLSSETAMPLSPSLLFTRLGDLEDFPVLRRLAKKLRIIRSVRTGVELYTSQYTLNEDLFWSDRAKLFYPGFKVAPVDVGLRFAFERFPRYCFQENNHELPFGCHAWAKWDREFWEPYLLT